VPSTSASRWGSHRSPGPSAQPRCDRETDPPDHCRFYAATQGDPLKRAIRAFLTKRAAPDGRIAPQPAGTADLKKWITWSVPSLAGDGGWISPRLTSKGAAQACGATPLRRVDTPEGLHGYLELVRQLASPRGRNVREND